MKNLVLFDIDNTLFDSASYRQKFFKEIAGILKREKGIQNGEELCLEIYDPIRIETGIFPPQRFADEIIRKTGVNKKVRKEIINVIFSKSSLGGNIYDEVSDTLFSLQKIVDLGIFSQGHLKLQQAKIRDITHLFQRNHTHIVKNKMDIFRDVFKRYKKQNVFLIDDALPVLCEVKKAYPNVVTVWVKRGRWAERQEDIPGFTPDAIVKNLAQASRFVTRRLDK